ncbi:hypothetical protein [Azonexus sp. IMCC34839]|uniref:hypothetical protein n=1 Tax=Azonexus sp. IMCC34839 TaxID=3133695 RepID=UPI0039997AC9
MDRVYRSLPTTQRNALCRHFERADFTPEEVAALGRRRLARLEGIGNKGLSVIEVWLAGQGVVLAEPVENPSTLRRRMESRLARAASLLRAHGYEVEPGQMIGVMQKTD